MNHVEFETACTSAVAGYHDQTQDGPLLISIRSNAGFSDGKWQTWTEYAAVIGHWPTQVPFGDYGQYMVEPRDAIVDLVKFARAAWKARQPERDEEEDFIRAGGDVICWGCNQPYKKHPYSHEEGDLFQGQPFLNVLCDGTKVKL